MWKGEDACVLRETSTYDYDIVEVCRKGMYEDERGIRRSDTNLLGSQQLQGL